MTLRNLILNATRKSIEVFGTNVNLVAPDGVKYENIVCQFLSGRVTESPDSGEDVVVFRPVASFHRSSLTRIPQNGENWFVEAPLDPDKPNDLTALTMDQSKSIEGGRSLGVIRLYLSETRQSV